MGWEERSGRLYYYRKEREGSRVRSVYCGSGLLAEANQALAQLNWLERQEWNDERDAWLEAEAEVERACKENERLVNEAIENAGYHKHRGQWRKRRGGQAGPHR